jgi:hypothetical protein
MTHRPRFPSFQEIVDALQARPLDVAQRYAPGGGHLNGGRWWALNPGRNDRHVGSFHVSLTGAYAGRWRDEATGDHGDMLDLIKLALNCDQKPALAEARAFLGMDEETPAQAQLRQRQAEKIKAQAERDARDHATNAERKRGAAQALFMRCHERIEGTPVAAYLAGRGIGLDRLGRTPRAIRFHPALHYHHTTDAEIDRATGEVIRDAQVVEGEWPCMVTAIGGPPGKDGAPFWGVHRTWLAQREDGSWGKAPVPAPKKVQGSMKGGFIRLVRGIGPRGGSVSMARAPEGSRAYIAEGIEDALSIAVINRMTGEPRDGTPWYAFAAISLGNLREVALPKQFRSVVVIADNDAGERERVAVDRAVDRFAREGRAVKVWRNRFGGKDANDALRAALEAEREGRVA